MGVVPDGQEDSGAHYGFQRNGNGPVARTRVKNMADANINEINALGEVEFDQDIDNEQVVALDGGVAANGDIEESAVNTGINTGILAGDDVTLQDSVLGNGNFQVNDSSAGAFAIGGDATNAQGENVNLGSGTLVDTAALGDAQVTVGDGNEVQGDVNVAAVGVDGPLNLAIGDDNAQQGLEDNSTTISDSFNLDASVNDSFNLDVTDSGNLSVEDNDVTESTVTDSGNLSVEDNDLTSISESFESNFSSVFESNDTTTSVFDLDMEEITVLGDANDVDLDG